MKGSVPAQRPALAVIGVGRAGGALATLLAGAGWPVRALWSRRPGRSRAVARRLAGRSPRLPAPLCPTHMARAAAAARVVLLAVPDDALAATAASLADSGLSLGRHRFLHLSGAHPAAVLGPLAHAGARIGSLHPMAMLPAGAPPAGLLDGALFAVDGDAAAVRLARRMARSLGGVPTVISPGRRASYHLAASLVANDGVALFELALQRLRAAGVAERPARLALARLLADAARALGSAPPEKALTGPVARGDVHTVESHLLAAGSAETRDVHVLLSRVLLRLARRGNRLGRRPLAELQRVLRLSR